MMIATLRATAHTIFSTMQSEKTEQEKQLEYELSIAKEKLGLMKLTGEIFMSYILETGSSIVLSEHKLEDISNAYALSIEGIINFTE